MAITDREIDQAFSDLKSTCGGVRNDYFGLLYLENEFSLPRERAILQVAFGGNDYGFDGFYFDESKRNLYLFQFKNSENHGQFKQSFQRLIDAGMQQMFSASAQDKQINQLVTQLKSCILENEAVIDRVYVHFVFTGDTSEAERSQVLAKLCEDLENKKYLIDQRFGRQVTMVVEFRSARSARRGGVSHQRKTRSYFVRLEHSIGHKGPGGETMTVGFMTLQDLNAMYQEMGHRFFERNIRASLPDTEPVNRSIQRSLKRIVIEGKEDAASFAFSHNGVTLSAEALVHGAGVCQVTEPRLLNGAQTVTTFSRFLKANEGNPAIKERSEVIARLQVMCRLITEATPEFVTAVTVNNNRQNPVAPWSLRANDMIQLELHDKFRNDLGTYYERQEGAFTGLSDEDLVELGCEGAKPIELTRLARTFLAVDGELDKLSRFREVFEDDRVYGQVFAPGRLEADSRHIVLCYKVQFRLRRVVNAIVEKGVNKYAFVQKARNLLWAILCQAMLNSPDLEKRAEQFGRNLSLEAQYTEWLVTLATTRVRLILSDLIADKSYVAKVTEGNYSFMRTNGAFKRSMEIAHGRYKWVTKRMNK